MYELSDQKQVRAIADTHAASLDRRIPGEFDAAAYTLGSRDVAQYPKQSFTKDRKCLGL
jgi:hypothetical protein